MKTETVSVERPGTLPGTITNGYVDPAGSSTIFDVICNIQPVSGKTILNLPTQDRDRASLEMRSGIEILNRDKVTRDGVVYQAKTSQDWQKYLNLRTQHFYSILFKIEPLN